ncbi:iron ABC transporter permease [Tepidanaerobacter syntrophicus]|uniref:ABC transporter permease n=1 Tax=Tepidanaerobacter syntrophicus TaxID=224999 RepID=UPI001BD638CB|nr:iron ABC transporter permease [Tepidanaerobacter syntrophicus]GLI50719.1 iron ABC transporter permease [Tepidanaerobacter syntrophicus]
MRENKRELLSVWNLISLFSLIVIGIFIGYPLLRLFIKSFLETGSFSLQSYKDFFSLPYYFSTLKNSLVVCTCATVCATAIGLPMAYIVSRFDIPCKRLINICVILSLMSPPFIGAYSWILLLGRNGFITNTLSNIGIDPPTIYGFGGILLVFTLKFYPYVYLYVSGALQSIDSSLEEAAENLGVSGLKKLFTVTFPLILPTIASGALMVFMTSLADFGTPMLIGEGYRVLPVVVYTEFMSETGGNTSMASTLSVIIIVCSTAILFLQKWYVDRKNYQMSALRPPKISELKPLAKFLATAFCFVCVFLAMLPQITVLVTSFIKTNGPIFVKGFSLDSYFSIFYKLGRNIKNTFVFSTIAIIIMVIAGMLLSYLIVRKRNKLTMAIDALIMLPYVIPGAVLGITLLGAFNKPPIIISGTAAIMVLSYVIRKLPYTIRSSTAILYQIDPSIDEASISLGVSPIKTFFKVTAPMMMSGVLSGAVISWITTINELSSSIILYTGKTGTISVAIYSEVARGGYGTAAALASILTVVTTVSLLIFFAVTKSDTISV